ncbi:hypothetical protein RRG08_022713 [Elysia crispata]|uniref:non-specific serine/threonine protein kinase n=1 Tax=Elysia crispata TaxID=231223 RepID=A0AAE0ZE02_9GAST|nr:hypothetical protein RRG08_022713 [Elysia crispata]
MFDLHTYHSDVISFAELQDPEDVWELGETIGEGTYGAVYLGTHKVTDQKAAVKVLENVSQVLEEIEEEYRILQELGHHPNMPDFLGIYLKGGRTAQNGHRLLRGEEQVWIVMELCGAGSVIELVRYLLRQAKQIGEMLIAHIMKETLLVLEHLHSHCVIHRDVKGHNILLTSQGEVKLIDFGVSGHLDSPLGRRKTHVGTPYWMAPEVIACEQQMEYTYDVRCDVWSLGITAIELGDGKPPLGDQDPRRALFRIPRSPPPRLRHANRWSDDFNDFIATCLIKDFEKRPYVAELLTHPFIKQVPEDTTDLRRELIQLSSTMEQKVSEPDITTKHGQFKSNRKSRRETTPTVENLALLEVLDEESIVEQLSLRYAQDEIYTYIGDILLAVNPFISLPIYSDELAKRYMHSRKTDNSPHIFAVADHSYQMMMHNRRNQCIVISGESGAGKTESANLLVQQLTQLGKAPNRTLEDRILQMNPLMEAFGNAKTVINDNSSRFGKYLEMFFTAASGTVVGAKITEYLLEKSRVINQALGEQNFHIFYYIHDGLVASDREAEYHLKPNTLYKYIGQYTGAPTNVACMSVNRVRFKAIEHCFESIGFKREEVTSVYAILAAILHAGNIEFVQKESEYGGDACRIHDLSLISTVSELLGLDYSDILESLTTTGMVAKGEVIIRENSIREAQNARDAMAKALYGRLFSWIVNRVSSLLKPDRIDHSQDESYATGLLDIFGFENLKTNSFEQLCINIANEQIQYYFNQHIFAWELEEYRNEGVNATEVTYVDNRPILDMFLSKPVGLLALLDEESHFPRATDTTLVEKLNQNITSPIYSGPKSKSSSFCIDHFAGKIEYDAGGFLEKNRDRLPIEIMNIMRMSKNKVVKHLFQTPLTKTGNLKNSGSINSLNSSRANSPMTTLGQGSQGGSTGSVNVTSYNSQSSGTMGGSKHASGSASMTRMQQTVATYFRYSLMDLLNKMVAGTPHFVRCIKPNDQKEPGNLVPERVTIQLRYTGVLETTRIRRQGFSHRITFSDFIKRYHVLGFRHDEAVSVTAETCGRLLNNIGLQDWALGNSKVFLKYYHIEFLAQAYEAMCQKIVRVQAYVRMWLARSRFSQMRWKRDKASIVLQKHMRGFIHRRKFTAMIKKRNDAAMQIQKVLRGRYTRQKIQPILIKRQGAAVQIQACVRGFITRRKVEKLRTIKEEEELKNKQTASASTIQRIYRLYRVKRRTAEMREKEVNYHKGKSATKIQAFYRMWRQKVVYHRLKRQRETQKDEVKDIGKQVSHKNHKMVKIQEDTNQSVFSSPSSPAQVSEAKHVSMTDRATTAFKESPKRRAGNSKFDSPRKKIWTRASIKAVGEARVEQMKKMHDIKKVIPVREADYYDQVSLFWQGEYHDSGYRIGSLQAEYLKINIVEAKQRVVANLLSSDHRAELSFRITARKPLIQDHLQRSPTVLVGSEISNYVDEPDVQKSQA